MTEYKTLHITRQFQAPIEQVWDAWTMPEHFKEWYSPDMFTIPVCELDVRLEGSIRVDMKGPDGTIYPSSGVFKVVDKPNELAFTSSPLGPDGNKLFEVMHTVKLSEEGGMTILNLTSEVLSAGPDAAPYLKGMEMGLNQAIDKLEKVLRR